MHIQNNILEAIDQVLAWNISEESLSHAIGDQAAIMSHLTPEERTSFHVD